uniref:Uncharacterized protein n=1 Tax=Oryza brachyantha TaxID=4533 RepID=J3MW20_ORYBR
MRADAIHQFSVLTHAVFRSTADIAGDAPEQMKMGSERDKEDGRRIRAYFCGPHRRSELLPAKSRRCPSSSPRRGRAAARSTPQQRRCRICVEREPCHHRIHAERKDDGAARRAPPSAAPSPSRRGCVPPEVRLGRVAAGSAPRGSHAAAGSTLRGRTTVPPAELLPAPPRPCRR